MPAREGSVRRLEQLGREERLVHAQGGQWMWYQLVAAMTAGRSVLDVGAATGYGMDILRAGGAALVHGIDPMPLREDVSAAPIADVQTRSYEYVVACDVIEHVEDDAGFLAQLERVATRAVFFSTPNWLMWHAQNEFHFREYTPEELTAFLGARRLKLWGVDGNNAVRPIARLLDVDASVSAFGVWIDLE